MRTIIRAGLTIFILQLFLFGSISAWATSHKYDTGVVTSVSDTEIMMGGKVYNILPTTKVIRVIKDAKGAYYESKGQLSDVKVGEKLFLKVVGSKILEVVVKR